MLLKALKSSVRKDLNISKHLTPTNRITPTGNIPQNPSHPIPDVFCAGLSVERRDLSYSGGVVHWRLWGKGGGENNHIQGKRDGGEIERRRRVEGEKGGEMERSVSESVSFALLLT